MTIANDLASCVDGDVDGMSERRSPALTEALRDRWRVTVATPEDMTEVPLRVASVYGGMILMFL